MNRLRNFYRKLFAGEELTFESNILSFVCLFGAIAAILALASRLIAGLPFVTIAPLLLMIAAIIGVFLLSLSKVKYANLLTSLIVCSVSLIFWPLLFFTIGGPTSGMAVYFALAIILDFTLLKGKTRIFVIIVTIAVTVVCYAGTLFLDWAVLPEGGLDRFQLFVDLMQSILIVGFLMGFINLYQAKLYQNEKIKVEESAKMLSEAVEDAKAANQAKSAFLSTMSHEIRTPMNAILGIAEIQLQDGTLDKDVREALVKIYASGDMLLGIINDILDLSKIEAGKLDLMIDEYDVASLISDTAQLNMMRIGSKPIDFELSIDENIPKTLRGDELRIKQILNNILSNAFKYTAAGVVRLSAFCESPSESDDNMTILFRISDTGQGMTKEQVDRLFDEYSRFNMDANRATEGTGLGMSITRNLLQLMGGRIAVDSAPGEGSIFSVYIPQVIVDAETLGREMAWNLEHFRTRSRVQMRGVQISREPMPYGKVLVVDDVETNIYVARGLLAPYDLTIDSADSGSAAIEKIKSGAIYDIVFMDHMMPLMDGIEATKIIRSMGYERPVVALTANAVSGQADVFLGNGFDDFISKPIDVRQLNNVLNKLVRDKYPPEVVNEARRRAQEDRDKSQALETQSGLDPRFAEVFVRDAVKALAVLDAIDEKHGVYSEEEIHSYIINIHGMKGALGNIGESDLSAFAGKLEKAGRSEDIGMIASETQIFTESLREVIEKLSPKEDTSDAGGIDGDNAFLCDRLLAIKTACVEFDESTAESIVAELREMTWAQPTRELLRAIAEHILHSDFEEVAIAVDNWLEK